jgi:hypothetical protein
MGPALQGDDAYAPLPKSPLGVDVLAGTLAQSPARLSAVMVTMSASSVTPAVCAKALVNRCVARRLGDGRRVTFHLISR